MGRDPDGLGARDIGIDDDDDLADLRDRPPVQLEAGEDYEHGHSEEKEDDAGTKPREEKGADYHEKRAVVEQVRGGPRYKDQVGPDAMEAAALPHSEEDNRRKPSNKPHQLPLDNKDHALGSSDQASKKNKDLIYLQGEGPQYKDQMKSNNARHATECDEEAATTDHLPSPRVDLVPTSLPAPSSRDDLVPSSSPDQLLVSAFAVDQTAVVAQATPVAQIRKRRLLLGALILMMIVAAIVTAIVLSGNAGDDSDSQESSVSDESAAPTITPSPTLNPSFAPTGNPTVHPRNWIRTGTLDNFGSDDRFGTQVAISRKGLLVAVSSSSDYYHEATVFKWSAYGWERLIRMRLEWCRSIALADSGYRMAVGQPIWLEPRDYVNQDDDSYNTTGLFGSVQVFQLDTSLNPEDLYGDDDNYDVGLDKHNQIGSTLVSPYNDTEFGYSVDLSADGNILIVGSSSTCFFYTYHFEDESLDWVSFGNNIDCEDVYSASFGTALSMSADGLVVAIGEPVRDYSFYEDENGLVDDKVYGNINDFPGYVIVFKFNGSFESGSWEKLGEPLAGDAGGDAFGSTVSLSDDGMVLAVGAPLNNGNAGPNDAIDASFDAHIGSCHLFRYDTTSGLWQQLGTTIGGDARGDQFGTSVSLNANGTVVAASAINSNAQGDDSGKVRVFEFDSKMMDWIQVGLEIPGPFEKSQFGASVALSADGDVVVVGIPNGLNEMETDRPGSVQVFETGILHVNGYLPVTLAIQLGNDTGAQDVAWSIQRLDVEVADIFVYSTTPFYTYGKDQVQDISETVLLNEGGVYRFALNNKYRDEERSFHLYYGDEDTSTALNENLIISGNFTNTTYHEISFRTPPADEATTTGSKRDLTLRLSFDSSPQDVHWVIVSNKLGFDDDSGRMKPKRIVMAFGPEEPYMPGLAGRELEIPIEIYYDEAEMTAFKFIYSDFGQDGLCCGGGSGSFALFEGDKLLFEGDAEGKRREVVSFSLNR